MTKQMTNYTTVLVAVCLFIARVSCISQCQEIQNAASTQNWQIIKMSPFDQMFLLTAGSLSLALLILGLITWIAYRSFETPADIMFAIVVSELLQNTTLVAQAGYFASLNGQIVEPSNFSSVCFWMGVANIFSNVLSTYYNLIFCIILAYSIKKTLKGYFFNRFRYHMLSFMITGGVILTLILTQSIGRGLNGICGFRVASSQSTARFLIQILIASICIFSMVKFKTKLPKNQYFKKQSVFGFYYYYMGSFAATLIISSISLLISDIMCNANSSDIISTLHVFYAISICTQILLSYAIVFMRFSHPLLWVKIRKLVRRKAKINQSQKQMNQLGISVDLQSEQIIKDEEGRSWLGCLLQSLKGSQILSFMQGITVAFIQKERKYYSKEVTPLAYQRHYTFQISEKIVQSFIQSRISSRQSLIVKNKLEGLTGLHYQVVSYCPQVFSSLCTKKELRNVIKSLDIKKNIKIVKKQSYTNGGKSGQLFFGTYDNHLLFKTVQQDEALSYLSKIRQFNEYFQRQAQTLIVKILGMFRFQRKDIKDQPIYIMVMYNITMMKNELNMRVYDIKGSEFNRSTMHEKNLKTKDQKLRKYTLKDKDFIQLQKKIRIKSNFSRDLRRIARKDIEFLSILGLIDYSFLIIKREGIAPHSQRGLSQISSAEQEGVIYNFGIIDYLQSWTLKRKAQRVLKTLITNQQVTAHSPMNYSTRLIQFIDSIL